MPVVPFAPQQPSASAPVEPPREDFALMAAAQMHAEKRLLDQTEEEIEDGSADLD